MSAWAFKLRSPCFEHIVKQILFLYFESALHCEPKYGKWLQSGDLFKERIPCLNENAKVDLMEKG